MDADLSHNPEYLPALTAGAATADVVIGSRYLNGVSVVNWPLHRIFLSAFANRYIRAVTRLSPTDCTSGFRCWRREALARLPLDAMVSDGYAFLVEMLFDAARNGCRIGEVPIIFVERRQGQSKLSSNVLVESVIMPWRLKLRRARRLVLRPRSAVNTEGGDAPGAQGARRANTVSIKHEHAAPRDARRPPEC